MKKGMFACTAALALILAPAALAQEPSTKVPLHELSDAYDNIANGKYDEALNTLMWLFEEGPIADPDFTPIKVTCVVDAMATVAEVHPPAMIVIRAKRDAKIATLGATPDLKSPVLHDAMLLNCVLGDYGKNQDLVQYAAKEGTIKKFSSGTPPPAPPNLVNPDIKRRVQTALQLIQVSTDAQAAGQISLFQGRCGNEMEFRREEQKVVVKEIDTLRAQLKTAKAPKDKANLTEKLNLKLHELEAEIKPTIKDLSAETEYY